MKTKYRASTKKVLDDVKTAIEIRRADLQEYLDQNEEALGRKEIADTLAEIESLNDALWILS